MCADARENPRDCFGVFEIQRRAAFAPAGLRDSKWLQEAGQTLGMRGIDGEFEMVAAAGSGQRTACQKGAAYLSCAFASPRGKWGRMCTRRYVDCECRYAQPRDRQPVDPIVLPSLA